MTVTVELVLFSYDLNPSSSQDIFHSGAVEIGEFLVELSVSEESLLEIIKCSLLIAKWNGDLLLVEASDVVVEWLTLMLLDFVEIS